MDLIKAKVRVEGFEMQVAQVIDEYMMRQKDEVLEVIKQEMESLDFRDIIRDQIRREAHKKVDSLIRGAFQVDWDVEKELRNAVAKMFVEKFSVKNGWLSDRD